MATIDADGLSVDLCDKLGEVLQTEFVHVLVSEVDRPVRVGWVKDFAGQDWMSEQLAKDLWC